MVDEPTIKEVVTALLEDGELYNLAPIPLPMEINCAAIPPHQFATLKGESVVEVLNPQNVS